VQIEDWTLVDRIAHHLIRGLTLLLCLGVFFITVGGVVGVLTYGSWDLVKWGREGFDALRSSWTNGLLSLISAALVAFIAVLVLFAMGRIAWELARSGIRQFEFSEWWREWFEINSDEVPYSLEIRIRGLAFILYLIVGTLRSLLFAVAIGSVWMILHSRRELVSVCLGTLGLLISFGIMWADARASHGEQ
jgi:hypothetical protein